MLKNKKILLIIGGGISAFKSLDLIRILKKNQCEIKTILTKSGKEFVTPLSLSSLSGNKTYLDLFDSDREAEMDHISLSRWADLILVIPTTANFMTKLVSGKSEDLATTVILASNKQIFLVPAMNVRMWLHRATQNNFKTLLDYGYRFIGPIEGEMACGEYGEGKMSSPRQIFSEIKLFLSKKYLVQKNKIAALVTAGPTREYIDPVRFISNESSGKQGYEIAKALHDTGVKTTLITGPTDLSPIKGMKVIKVCTGKEMFEAVKKELPVDIAICSAAVSDFKPEYSKKKIKKNSKTAFKLSLTKNIDILDYLGKNNRHRPKFVVGFSAETENLISNSEKKIKNKNCDLIIANNVSKKDIGFNVDFNQVELIYSDGKKESIKKNRKSIISSIIVKKILSKFLFDDKNLN
jgi:phosphopantothenoylcysteine decarboxylase/phosphopantothenate--cysteine ligase